MIKGVGVKIVTVAPFSRGLGKETLAYFTAKDIREGTLVTVPLRGKKTTALVIKTEKAELSKTDIKAADFKLKKIIADKGFLFLPSFMRAGERSAEYFASTLGAVLNALTPEEILKDLETASAGRSGGRGAKEEKTLPPAFAEKLVFQTDERERMTLYRSLIREEFAKKYSLFLCLPTITDIERAREALEKGIEEHVYVFHSELPKKDLRGRWKKALKSSHPIFVIATGAFFSLPRDDVSVYILEREHSPAWKSPRRPFLDIRIFAEHFARERGAKLILGDLKLRTETLFRKEAREFAECAPLKQRAFSAAESFLVDMKEDNKDPYSGKTRFAPLGKSLSSLIGNVAEHGGHLFALASRRGLHPLTVCNDCGKVVICARCKAPLTLHAVDSSHSAVRVKNIFMCHPCGRETVSSDRCDSCMSWRLAPLGIGTEFVEEALKKDFPLLKILRLDKETGDTRKKALGVIGEFYASPAGVLVGTEFALTFLSRVTHAAVVSCDALFSIPDFRMNERVFAMLLALRAKAEKTFLMQTRMPEMPLWRESVRGNISDFYREELAKRKEFGYPPFTTLIKISSNGKEAVARKEMAHVEELFREYSPLVYPALRSAPHAEVTMRALLKVAVPWPDQKLRALLSSLPPSLEVRVDPEDTL